MLLDLLYEAIDKYIPRLICRKHRLWKLYLQTNETNVYNNYCKISNQICLFTRQSIKNL